MKYSILFSALLMTLTFSVASPAHPDSLVEVIKTNDKNLLVLELDKKFMGAYVEVVSANGECMIFQKARGRRMNIVLSHADPGTYTVNIEMNGAIEKFQFVKK